MTESTPFVLKGGEAFSERRKSVFDQLGSLESDLKKSSSSTLSLPDEDMDVEESQPEPHSKRGPRRSNTKHFRGKESIFKRPDDPKNRNFFRQMPDFKKNPHKWVKYSLDDVRDEDISDKGNTRAAMSFLNELRHRKSTEEATTTESKDEGKIVFKKRSSIGEEKPQQINNAEEDNKVTFRSSKVVMPEYVVGQKVAKERKNREVKNSTSQQLKLQHLYEEDD